MQIHLDNQGEEGLVTITATGRGAVRWAKDEHQTVAGSHWEGIEREDPDFAYAVVSDHPGLLKELEAEGYDDIDDAAYSPPSEAGPERQAVALLGDVNYVEHGGAVVYPDGTMDVVEPGDEEGSDVVIYTLSVPEDWSSEWWAKDIDAIAETSGTKRTSLIRQLASKDLKVRAAAFYFAVLAYWSAAQFDESPVTLTADEAEKRYERVVEIA